MATARRANASLLLGLILLAFLLRCAGLASQSLWRDEVDVILFATRPLRDLLATFLKPGENGPLYFLVMRPWLAAAGVSEFALRLPAVIAGTLCIPLTYVLVRRLTGRRVARLAALLTVPAPYLLWYSQDAKMYAPVTALVLLALYLTVVALQRGGWWRWALLYIVTSLSIYTHVLAALVISVQVVWLLLLPSNGRRMRARWVAVAGYLAALVLPYLPLAWWQARLWSSPTFTTGHPFVALPDIARVMGIAYASGILSANPPVLILPAMLALLAGLILWTPLRRNRGGLLVAVWLFVPTLALYGVSLGMPLFADRYLIWVIPAALALAAMGIDALAASWRPLAVAVCGAMLALYVVGCGAQVVRPIKSDLRSAARYVSERRQPDDVMVYQLPYVRHTFTYYSSGTRNPRDRSWRWIDGPYTNAGTTEEEAGAALEAGSAGARVAWLVESEAEAWDARGLARHWLETHGTLTERAEFARVTVSGYKLNK